MDLQTLIVIGIVVLCVGYLIRRFYRDWLGKGASGCHGSGCAGCAHHHGCTDDSENEPRSKPPLDPLHHQP